MVIEYPQRGTLQVTTLFFTEKHYATEYESTLLSEWQQSESALLLWIQTLIKGWIFFSCKQDQVAYYG